MISNRYYTKFLYLRNTSVTGKFHNQNLVEITLVAMKFKHIELYEEFVRGRMIYLYLRKLITFEYIINTHMLRVEISRCT